MKIDNEISLDFDDVLLMPQRSTLNSRSDIILDREFYFYHSPRKWVGIPIICSNMSFSSFPMAEALRKYRMITCLHKYHTLDELVKYFNVGDINSKLDYVWISIGCREKDLDLLQTFQRNTLLQPNICIDVPNGHMDSFVEFCAKVREEFSQSIIMAGNVTNPASTQELIIHGGVDISKTSIGPGSACSTRFLTGCGTGSLSSNINNSYVAHGLQREPRHIGLICSDGGHKNPGDVCKSLASGADFVMLGGYWAGTEPCIGEWTYERDEKTLLDRKSKFTYYGMSTHHSQLIFENEQKDYRASEGTKITVSYKGLVDNVVKELLGGIRSCCCYIGADSIKNMNKCAHFCRVNQIHQNKNPQLGV